MPNATKKTCPKSLYSKYLRQILRRKFVVTPYVARVYVELFRLYYLFHPTYHSCPSWLIVRRNPRFLQYLSCIYWSYIPNSLQKIQNIFYSFSVRKTKVVANHTLVKIHGSETHILDFHSEQETLTGHILERNHLTHKLLTHTVFNRKNISNRHFLFPFLLCASIIQILSAISREIFGIFQI